MGCACMGPQNGEPLCPCQMQAARSHVGQLQSSTFTSSDLTRALDALAACMKALEPFGKEGVKAGRSISKDEKLLRVWYRDFQVSCEINVGDLRNAQFVLASIPEPLRKLIEERRL